MPTDGKLHFRCPNCRKPLRVPREHSGRRGGCPKCGSKFIVPTSSSPKAPKRAPPPPFGRPRPANTSASASQDDLIEQVAERVIRPQVLQEKEATENYRRLLWPTLLGGGFAIAGVLLSIIPVAALHGWDMSGSGNDLIIIGVPLTMTAIGAVLGILLGLRMANRVVTVPFVESPLPRVFGVEMAGSLVTAGELEEGERTLWQTKLVKKQMILGGCLFSAVSLVFLLIALLDSNMKVVIRGTNIEIPAWVVGLVFIGSVSSLITAVVTSIGTSLTITTRRTIYKELNATTEILHTELGEIETATNHSAGPGAITSVTIGSTREDGREIVLPETGHAEHIKKLLERVKKGLAGKKQPGNRMTPSRTFP